MQKGFAPIIILVMILVIALAGVGIFYTLTSTLEQVPIPGTNADNYWKTYTDKNKKVGFKYPNYWKEKPSQISGTKFIQEFEGLYGIDGTIPLFFTFSSEENFNKTINRPYATIDEFIGLPYKVAAVTFNGREGRQPLPRAGSENVIAAHVFSKDSKLIYGLSLKVGNTPLDTSEEYIETGQKIFDQILSTFKFTQ